MLVVIVAVKLIENVRPFMLERVQPVGGRAIPIDEYGAAGAVAFRVSIQLVRRAEVRILGDLLLRNADHANLNWARRRQCTFERGDFR